MFIHGDSQVHYSQGRISGTISKLASVDKELSVVRKVRKSDEKNRWCFVLRSEKATLDDLEKQWSMIHLQTNWKIEPCFKPAKADSRHTITTAAEPPPSPEPMMLFLPSHSLPSLLQLPLPLNLPQPPTTMPALCPHLMTLISFLRLNHKCTMTPTLLVLFCSHHASRLWVYCSGNPLY